MNIKTLIWNDAEVRLRSGWRVFVTVAAMMLTFLPIQWMLKSVMPSLWSKTQKVDFLLTIFSLVATFVIIFSRRFIDNRSLDSLGFGDRKRMLMDVAAGYAISAILIAIILMIEIGFGWLSISSSQLSWLELLRNILVLFVVSGLAVAWWENLFFVSYLFLNLRDGCGFWRSVALNCLVFGVIHSVNPNASVFSFLGIVLIHTYEIFGFLRTRTVWLILGIHAGWNFFQGFAGFSVSGRTGIQIISQTNSTPRWIGGGEFGPEAGVVVLVTSFVAFILITLYTTFTRKHQVASIKDWT